MTVEAGIYKSNETLEKDFGIYGNDVVRKSGLHVAARMLLIYLMSHEVGYTIKFAQIQEELLLGPRGYRAALKELQDAGWVNVTRDQKSNGQLGSYRYEITRPSTRVLRSTVARSTVLQGALLRREEDLEDKGLEDKDLRDSAQNKFERESLEQAFEQFWQIYDHKKAKPAAKKAFAKAYAKIGDNIIVKLQLWVSDPNRGEKAYWPHPATWLNNERWDDDPEPARRVVNRASEKTSSNMQAQQAFLAKIEESANRQLEAPNSWKSLL